MAGVVVAVEVDVGVLSISGGEKQNEIVPLEVSLQPTRASPCLARTLPAGTTSLLFPPSPPTTLQPPSPPSLPLLAEPPPPPPFGSGRFVEVSSRESCGICSTTWCYCLSRGCCTPKPTPNPSPTNPKPRATSATPFCGRVHTALAFVRCLPENRDQVE